MMDTLLIGLDGATFHILDPLMADGVMPFLRSFVRRGVRASLRSTINPVTPPAWTTIMTGRSPGQHGVFDFVRADERGGEVYFTLYDARDIGCETIWSMASRQNLKITSLNFPMMFPHPEVAGYIVPGLTSWRHLKLGMRPPELHEQLKELPDLDFREMAWDFEQGKKVVYGIEPDQFESWVDFHVRREQHWFTVAKYLMEHDPCELTAVLWDGPDKLSHICWRFLDPDFLPVCPTPWERKIRDLCLEYHRRLDGYIAELVTLAGPNARTLIVSDHGFGPSTEELHINTWLQERGYLTWRQPKSIEEAASASWKRRLKSNFVLLDWQRTKAYARTSSSNGIYIRRARTPGDGGVSDDDYEAFRDDLIGELYSIAHPVTGERIVSRVWKREDAFPGPRMTEAPDLTLVLRDYGFISIRNHSPALSLRSEVNGTHYPDGIFLAAGAGIRQNTAIGPLAIQDVAPTVLHSLGLEVPVDLEGSVPLGIFDQSSIHWREVRIGAPTASGLGDAALGGPEVPEDASGQEAIFERLKSLGYLE
jgi:predicted AlkP superfamily phosphohydrolase/phosphomutase